LSYKERREPARKSEFACAVCGNNALDLTTGKLEFREGKLLCGKCAEKFDCPTCCMCDEMLSKTPALVPRNCQDEQ